MLEALRSRLHAGAEGAQAALSGDCASRLRIAVGRMGVCAVSDFPSPVVSCDEDRSAAVTLSFHGALSGTAVIAMEPEQALAWVRATGAAGDPVASYVEIARSVVHETVAPLAQPLAAPIEWGSARLVEAPVVSVLLDTHAPSDTRVVGASLSIEAGTARFPACLYLLLDPKMLESWLAAIESSRH